VTEVYSSDPARVGNNHVVIIVASHIVVIVVRQIYDGVVDVGIPGR
jgi:hypothetical protein